MITDKIENYPMLNVLNFYIKEINGFIAGGCFRSIFEGNFPRDIDLFFNTEEDFLFAKDVYIGEEWKVAYENENAIGFYKKGKPRVDLVRSIYGTPENIISQFDFTIAKFAMDKEKVVYTETYWRDLHLKRLVCDDTIPKPIGTFERVQKYAKYGYFLCRETKVKIIKAIQVIGQFDNENISKNLYQGWD